MVFITGGILMFQGINLSVAAITADIIFGAIGLAAFIYGKKTGAFRPMIIGIVLTAALYFWRD